MVSFADEVDIVPLETEGTNSLNQTVSFTAPTKGGSDHGLIPTIQYENDKEIVTYHLGMLKVCC